MSTTVKCTSVFIYLIRSSVWVMTMFSLILKCLVRLGGSVDGAVSGSCSERTGTAFIRVSACLARLSFAAIMLHIMIFMITNITAAMAMTNHSSFVNTDTSFCGGQNSALNIAAVILSRSLRSFTVSISLRRLFSIAFLVATFLGDNSSNISFGSSTCLKPSEHII